MNRTRHPLSVLIKLFVVIFVSCIFFNENVLAAGSLEEIVVTAQKTTQNIQDVPIAITAMSGDMLKQRGITDVTHLSEYSPNVTLDAGTPFSASDTVLAAYIRGIGQNDFAFNLDPGVGVYVDGVYLARSVGANTSMLDVDRVEILKGPQGTLFGRNTIGGAISIVTRDPGDKFMAKAEITGGSYNRVDFQGTADIPISDKLGTTFSVSRQSRDGYQKRIPFPTPIAGNSTQSQMGGTIAIPDCDNLAPAGTPCAIYNDPYEGFPAADHRNPNEGGGIDKWSLRGKMVYDASDRLKLTLTADYTKVDEQAQANTTLTADPTVPIFGPLLGSFAGLYNTCINGVGVAGFTPDEAPPNGTGVLCTTPRLGLTPVPSPYPQLPALAQFGPVLGVDSMGAPIFSLLGVNNDGVLGNERLPYDQRYFIPGSVKTGNPNLQVNPDLSYATGSNFNELENYGIAGIIDYDINDNMHLKSITSYRKMTFKAGLDQDTSPIEILDVSFDIPQSQVSTELQLTGTAFDGRVDYVLGGYYFSEWGHNHDFVPFPGGLFVVDGPNDLETQAEAGFAHVDWRVTDQISLIGGFRYSAEQKKFEGHQTDDNALTYRLGGCESADTLIAPGLTCYDLLANIVDPLGTEGLHFASGAEPYRFFPPGKRKQNFDNFSPMGGIQYRLNDDNMFYFTYSEGYKSGSWTTRLSLPHACYYDLPGPGCLPGQTASSLEFSPETATTEELGWKSQWLDRSLRLNLAGFHTDYKDLQLQVQIGISPTFVNAGDAEIWGFEAEMEYAVTDNFNLNAGVGYTDAKYTRLAPGVADNGFALTLNSCPQRTLNPNPAAPPQNGACELAKTPKWKIFVGPQYVIPLTNIGGELQFNLDYTYTSHYYNTTGNLLDTERLATDIMNISATYRSPSDRWELVIGGTNVLDDRYVLNGYENGAVVQSFATFSRPAEWYATLRLNYD